MAIEDQDRFSERITSSCNISASVADHDFAKYRPMLYGLDVPDKQADELLRILWDMMRSFVELDVPSENWGQIIETIIDPTSLNPPSVES